jgi:hypothetical protein
MAALPFPDEVRDRVVSYIQHQGTKSPEALVGLVKTSQQRFLDVISEVPDEVAAKTPVPDEWSLRELVRHVLDAEDSVATLVHNLSRGMGPPSGRGAGRMVEDDGGPFRQFVDQAKALNERMLYAIEGMPADPDLEEKAPHPFFGMLNCKEWAAFQRVHDEDHVQHAEKILAAVRG